jgi:transposase
VNFQNYLGVDLHKRRTYVVLMDKQGQVSDSRRLPNDEMMAYVKQLPSNTFAVVESTGNWSYMYDILNAHLDQVVLVHPKRVRAIASARVKTDKIDATTLAHLARADLLPTAYAAPLSVRQLREIVRHRSKLVRERTRHKNRIHHILSQYNLHPPCSDLFGKRGREFLWEGSTRLSDIHQHIVEVYLQLIDDLNEQIKKSDKILREWMKGDARARLLMTMPGVGLFTAAVILAEIGDIRRFPSAKKLCSFAGLVPSTRASDSRVYHGAITKEGSSWLRWIMVNAAQQAPRGSQRLNTFFERVAQNQDRKTARVALARKMLSIVFYMLQRNEPYCERYQQG